MIKMQTRMVSVFTHAGLLNAKRGRKFKSVLVTSETKVKSSGGCWGTHPDRPAGIFETRQVNLVISTNQFLPHSSVLMERSRALWSFRKRYTMA